MIRADVERSLQIHNDRRLEVGHGGSEYDDSQCGASKAHRAASAELNVGVEPTSVSGRMPEADRLTRGPQSALGLPARVQPPAASRWAIVVRRYTAVC